jgi:hypothetical protein
VAVKVTLVPAQIAPDGLADILTLAGRLGFTVIIILFEDAGDPVTQPRFEVITHLTLSLFANDA